MPGSLRQTESVGTDCKRILRCIAKRSGLVTRPVDLMLTCKTYSNGCVESYSFGDPVSLSSALVGVVPEVSVEQECTSFMGIADDMLSRTLWKIHVPPSRAVARARSVSRYPVDTRWQANPALLASVGPIPATSRSGSKVPRVAAITRMAFDTSLAHEEENVGSKIDAGRVGHWSSPAPFRQPCPVLAAANRDVPATLMGVRHLDRLPMGA
jgi:hypothetical protein